ncbi:MAG: tetratricopeptide repeat protein [Acidobacteria bacterium]|nr:tetratricopeptide repeat protein [Acidobacteriota bacterium]
MIHRSSSNLFVVVLGAILCAAAVRGWGQAAAPEEAARRRLDTGLSFMETGRFDEALKDFQVVVEAYPNTSVADDALLQIAQYHFDTRNFDAAQGAAQMLVTKYEQGDAAPMGHILVGRIALARGRTERQVDTALASFDRVLSLFDRKNEALSAALYYAAETLRIAGRNDEAIDKYRRVFAEYPASTPWAARAHLGLALALTRAGQPFKALEELHRVRMRHPASQEAVRALAWSTILYRLYLLGSAGQPPYRVAPRVIPPAAKLQDVVALGINAQDALVVVTNDGASMYDRQGGVARSLPAEQARAVFFDQQDRAVIIEKSALHPMEGGTKIAIAAPKPDNTPRPLEEIPAGARLSTDEILLVDRQERSIARFSSSGKYLDRFAPGAPARIAVDALDRVAALDKDAKTLTILGSDGRQISQIAARGPGYELKNPVDVAFDALGHLYVLDRDLGTVFVFGPPNRLVTQFSVPEKSPGAFRRAKALAVDSAGRLFIYDDRAERVQVYH